MAQDIAAIKVQLSADIAQLQRGMDRAAKKVATSSRKMERRVQKLDKRFSKVGKGFGLAIGGVLGVAGIRRFVSGITTAIDKLDDLAKSADKIGITTDALQELRVAAELSGIEAGVLDKAMIRFSVGIDEARRGIGESRDAFERLGITFTDNTGKMKTMEAILGEVADALAGMENEVSRTAIAADIFGTRGVAMINMLKNGAAAMEAMRAKARELGIVISEALIRRAVEAKDELFLLWKVIDTQVTVALADLAPHLVKASELLAAIAKEATFAANGWREILGLPSLRFPMEAARKQIEDISASITGLDEQIANLNTLRNIPLTDTQRAVQSETIAGRNELLADLIQRRKGLADELATVQTRLEKLLDPPKTKEPSAKTPRPGGVASAAFTVDDALSQLGREAAALELRINLIGRTTQEQAKLRAETEILNRLHEAGVELTEDQRKAIAHFADDIGFLTEMQERLQAETDATSQTMEDQADVMSQAEGAVGRIGDAFTQMALDGKIDFKSLTDSIIADFVRMETRLLTSKLFSGGGGGDLLFSLGRAVAGAFGGSVAPTSSPLPVPRPSAKGNVFAGGKVVPFAHGGIVNSPTVFPMRNGVGLMGEAGPEAILPLKRGRGGKLGVAASGGKTTIVVNNYGNDEVQADVGQGPSGEQLVEIVIGAVRADMGRGGFDGVMMKRFQRRPALINR